MSKESAPNFDNTLQAESSGNVQKKNNKKLIKMAVEQFASLLLKHSMLKKKSKGRQSKARPSTADDFL